MKKVRRLWIGMRTNGKCPFEGFFAGSWLPGVAASQIKKEKPKGITSSPTEKNKSRLDYGWVAAWKWYSSIPKLFPFWCFTQFFLFWRSTRKVLEYRSVRSTNAATRVQNRCGVGWMRGRGRKRKCRSTSWPPQQPKGRMMWKVPVRRLDLVNFGPVVLILIENLFVCFF